MKTDNLFIASFEKTRRINKVTHPKVSIIIVAYNNNKDVYKCLDSIYSHKNKTKFEIIVVDNGNKPFKLRNVDFNASIKYILSSGNIGYGAGNNLGIKYSQGKYILILNPDTQVLDTTIDKLSDFLDKHSKAAIVAPQLIDSKGKEFSQLGSAKLTPLRGIFALSILNKILPNNPISKRYWLFDRRMDILREVDVVPGSGMMIEKDIFEKVKGYDEKFFLYFEESDLCKRIQEKFPRYKFYIDPQIKLIHDWKPKDPGTKKSNQIFKQSRFYYFKKHYGYLNALIVEFFAIQSKRSLIIYSILFLLLILYLLYLRK
jgi:GT2 family glycosyltransferase